ncbi:MAG: hypothetical protein ACRC3J_01880 [Culicoidibacterales bacterium]
MITTLQELRSWYACAPGYNKLVCHLANHKYADAYKQAKEQIGPVFAETTYYPCDEFEGAEIDFLTILESNGIVDTAWCLRKKDHSDEIKNLQLQVARLLTPYLTKEQIGFLDEYEKIIASEYYGDLCSRIRMDAYENMQTVHRSNTDMFDKQQRIKCDIAAIVYYACSKNIFDVVRMTRNIVGNDVVYKLVEEFLKTH